MATNELFYPQSWLTNVMGVSRAKEMLRLAVAVHLRRDVFRRAARS
jgi:hypothetical protein